MILECLGEPCAVWFQWLGRWRQEDCLSPGVRSQPGEYRETFWNKQKKNQARWQIVDIRMKWKTQKKQKENSLGKATTVLAEVQVTELLWQAEQKDKNVPKQTNSGGTCHLCP
jgi:hypothetical protein